MRVSITVQVSREMKEDLDRIAREDGVSRSQIARKALEGWLFARKLRRLRRRMIPLARAEGIFTDEDVFERVS
jgi:predicted transcriptional regulator